MNAALYKFFWSNSYFFFNAQVHTPSGAVAARPDLAGRNAAKKDAINTATIEGGQYYLLKIADWNKIYG